MKIGIITIHKSEVNYGACLQSLALWKYITDQRHDCVIIDMLRPCHSGYRISPTFNEKRPSAKQKIKGWLLRILNLKKSKQSLALFDEKKRKFEQFNQYPRYTRTYHSVAELYGDIPECDLYITGSDQVWNPNRNFIKDPYFLTFVPEGKKKISYASSFAIENLPEALKPQYSDWLSSYESITTREASGARIVEELTGKIATVVADPVFLLPAKKWKEYAKEVEGLQPKAFVFAYFLHYNEPYINYAVKVAQKQHLPLIVVLSEDRTIDLSSVKQLYSIGPSEWLWLIDNTSMFVTSSFHGTAFSIIFKVPVTILMKDGVNTNSRITDLLSMLEAQCDEEKTSSQILALSVKKTNKEKLAEMIGKSCDYLSNYLS